MNSYESEMQDVERPRKRRADVHPVHFSQLVEIVAQMSENDETRAKLAALLAEYQQGTTSRI